MKASAGNVATAAVAVAVAVVAVAVAAVAATAAAGVETAAAVDDVAAVAEDDAAVGCAAAASYVAAVVAAAAAVGGKAERIGDAAVVAEVGIADPEGPVGMGTDARPRWGAFGMDCEQYGSTVGVVCGPNCVAVRVVSAGCFDQVYGVWTSSGWTEVGVSRT